MVHAIGQASRRLWRSRVAALGVILTLSFTVGISSAVFGIVDAVILDPLPYRDPDRLAMVWRHSSTVESSMVGSSELRDWNQRSRLYDGFSSVRVAQYRVRREPLHELADAHVVSADFFSLLGVTPLLGRVFNEGDDGTGSSRVALLSEAAWRQWFGADPNVIGSRVELAGRRDAPTQFEIVGVVGKDVRFHWLPPPSLFLPDVVGPGFWDPGAVRQVIARVKPGVTFGQAAAELTGVVQRGGPYPRGDLRVSLMPLADAEFGATWGSLRVIAVSVAFVMLMASLNMAALLLAVGASRRRELLTRLALGASRITLAKLLCTEQTLLAAAGAFGGILVCVAATRLLVSISPPGMPRIDNVGIDFVSLALVLSLTTITGLVASLVPVAVLPRHRVSSELNAAAHSSTPTRRRVRDSFLFLQLALVLALTIGAGLSLHSFWRLWRLDPGIRTDNVIGAEVWLGSAYATQPDELLRFQRELLRRLESAPGFTRVALAANSPLTLTTYRAALESGTIISVKSNNVTSSYFRLLDVPIVEGRTLQDRDDDYAVLVNETFARRYFPGESPVGQRLPAWGVNGPRDIVGVVGDSWTGPPLQVRGAVSLSPGRQMTSVVEPTIYSSLTTRRWAQSAFWLLVDSRLAEHETVARVREVVGEADSSVTTRFTTLDGELSSMMAPLRFYASVLGTLALTALILAALGVAAAGYEAVNERRREIGLRIALGATPRAVRRLMLRRVVVILIGAIFVGTWIGIVGVSGLRSVLFDIDELDVPTLLAAAFVLVCIVVLAAYSPARRASLVDPLLTLRRE